MIDYKSCIFVTGGAGFIGSELIRQLISSTDAFIVNIDKLTYAGNLSTLSDIDKTINNLKSYTNKLAILHCVSEYPVEPSNLNLQSQKEKKENHLLIL